MSSEKNQILHVEDRPDWLREVKLALGADYQIASARTLKEAAHLFGEMDFDLVIADIDLLSGVGADEEGFRLIGALHDAGILPGSRIIVLSGYADRDERTRRAFRDYGVWDVISKAEFDAEELQREVQEALCSPKYD
jgi:CheY-like chemotaxis protein